MQWVTWVSGGFCNCNMGGEAAKPYMRGPLNPCEISLKFPEVNRLSRYERERLPRIKAVYEKATDRGKLADKEELLYKPTFKHLWKSQVCIASWLSVSVCLFVCLSAICHHL